MTNTRSKKQAGFSILEVMISALILSTGLLGVASLQIVGMKETQQSSMKNQAMGVVQNITERMRANYAGVTADNYVIDSATFDVIKFCTAKAPDPSTCVAGAGGNADACIAKTVATADLHNLICGYGKPKTGGVKVTAAGDIGILVNGSLNIACAGAAAVGCTQGDIIITVGWDETVLGEEKFIRDSLILTTRIAAP